MTITTGELDQLIGWLERRDDEGQEYSAIKTKGALDLSRELIAARKVIDTVRPYREALDKLTGGNCDELDAELTAYNKIRYKE